MPRRVFFFTAPILYEICPLEDDGLPAIPRDPAGRRVPTWIKHPDVSDTIYC